MPRNTLSFLFLIFITSLLNAQVLTNPQTNGPILEEIRTDSTAFPRYRIVNIGYGGQYLRDPLLSALRYKGKAINCNIVTLKYRPIFLTNSSLSIHLNFLISKATGARIYEIGSAYSFSILKKINLVKNKSWQIYTGASAEALFNFRLALSNTNNVYSYDAMISIGVAALVQKSFKLFDRNFAVSNQFNIPVYSIISRPGYSWSYPAFAEEGGKLKDNIETGSFGKYFKMQNKLMIDFQLGMRHRHKRIGKSAWRFTYQYEYYNINQFNRVQSGTDLLMIGRIHRF